MKIYNTLTRRKEDFVPIESGKVKMYSCGPTVYNFFHIGNARPFLFFDVVRNYFQYCGYQVIYVQNITDIDDRLIAQSIKEQESVEKIAGKYTNAFFHDLEALEIKKADIQPKATEFITEMIELIKLLEEKGYAYESNGDVYFSVEKKADYGKLSGKNIVDLFTGARVEENFQKKNAVDFTLWKHAKLGEPKWQSPWGEGRPGWHSECVVMSQKWLGVSFDIHGGGSDLIFPHHENEIAQAEALSGKPFVNYWMHNGFLNISGEKMSKSLDNFFTARDILRLYKPEAIRFFFLSKHYRSPIDFNESILKESNVAVQGFYRALKEINYPAFQHKDLKENDEISTYINEFKEAMDDDFNTAKAIAVLFHITKQITNKNVPLYDREQYAILLVKLGSVLGFFQHVEIKLNHNVEALAENLIDLIISYRQDYKVKKNWEMADKIRQDLEQLGILLKDTKDGSIWEKKE
jgi:cysteinyl-tRNA synthetase